MGSFPQFELFTGQARHAVWLAHHVAHRLELDYLASEHLLAGLLRDGSAEINAAFRGQQLDPRETLQKLESMLEKAVPASSATAICLTPRAHRTLVNAVDFARMANASRAGPSHIALAILADEENSACDFLASIGFDFARGEQLLREGPFDLDRDSLVRLPGDGSLPTIDPSGEELRQLMSQIVVRPLPPLKNAEYDLSNATRQSMTKFGRLLREVFEPKRDVEPNGVQLQSSLNSTLNLAIFIVLMAMFMVGGFLLIAIRVLKV